MTKTETINGQELTFATITAGAAKGTDFTGPDGKSLPSTEFNRALILTSLRAGGHQDAETIVDGLPIFLDGAFGKALGIAIDVNGLRPQKGEDQPNPETVSA